MRDVRGVFAAFCALADRRRGRARRGVRCCARGRAARAWLWRRLGLAGGHRGGDGRARGRRPRSSFDAAFEVFHELFFPAGSFPFDPRDGPARPALPGRLLVGDDDRRRGRDHRPLAAPSRGWRPKRAARARARVPTVTPAPRSAGPARAAADDRRPDRAHPRDRDPGPARRGSCSLALVAVIGVDEIQADAAPALNRRRPLGPRRRRSPRRSSCRRSSLTSSRTRWSARSTRGPDRTRSSSRSSAARRRCDPTAQHRGGRARRSRSPGPLVSLAIAGAGCSRRGRPGSGRWAARRRRSPAAWSSWACSTSILGGINLVPAYPARRRPDRSGDRLVRGPAPSDRAAARRGACGRMVGLAAVVVGLAILLLLDRTRRTASMIALSGWFLIASARSIERPAARRRADRRPAASATRWSRRRSPFVAGPHARHVRVAAPRGLVRTTSRVPVVGGRPRRRASSGCGQVVPASGGDELGPDARRGRDGRAAAAAAARADGSRCRRRRGRCSGRTSMACRSLADGQLVGLVTRRRRCRRDPRLRRGAGSQDRREHAAGRAGDASELARRRGRPRRSASSSRRRRAAADASGCHRRARWPDPRRADRRGRLACRPGTTPRWTATRSVRGRRRPARPRPSRSALARHRRGRGRARRRTSRSMPGTAVRIATGARVPAGRRRGRPGRGRRRRSTPTGDRRAARSRRDRPAARPRASSTRPVEPAARVRARRQRPRGRRDGPRAGHGDHGRPRSRSSPGAGVDRRRGPPPAADRASWRRATRSGRRASRSGRPGSPTRTARACARSSTAAGGEAIDLGIARDDLDDVARPAAARARRRRRRDHRRRAASRSGRTTSCKRAFEDDRPDRPLARRRPAGQAVRLRRRRSPGGGGRPVLLFGLPGNPVSSARHVRAVRAAGDPARWPGGATCSGRSTAPSSARPSRKSPGRRAFLRVDGRARRRLARRSATAAAASASACAGGQGSHVHLGARRGRRPRGRPRGRSTTLAGRRRGRRCGGSTAA